MTFSSCQRQGSSVRRVAAARVAVLSVDPICREHVSIELDGRTVPPSQPGQFLELLCCDEAPAEPNVVEWENGALPQVDADALLGRKPFVRRPFSIADRGSHPAGRSQLTVISRTIGAGTSYLANLRPGMTLDVTGPLGRGFRVPENSETPMLLLGGGVGIPPLLYLARCLSDRGFQNVVCVFGATSGDLLPLRWLRTPSATGEPTECVSLPGGARFSSIVTTDDGTLGIHGRVTDAVECLSTSRAQLGTPLVMACGPEPMLHAVARQTRRLGWGCQLCIEKNMGCGLGTCLSCVVRKVDRAAAAGWRWALTCTDGPVFERDELVEFNA